MSRFSEALYALGMLLIPYAHESLSYRRMPYVTIGIIAICLLVQIAVGSGGAKSKEADIERGRARIVRVLTERPYLTIDDVTAREVLRGFPAEMFVRLEEARAAAERYHADPDGVREVLGDGPWNVDDLEGNHARRMLDRAFANSDGSQGGLYLELSQEVMMGKKLSEAEIFAHLRAIGPKGQAEEQAFLDQAIADYRDARQRDPYFAYGFVASRGISWGLVTHLFVHAGWLHLVGNMMFLWLVGFNVEDRWGRIFYPIFFFVGGGLAALAHVAMAGARAEGVPLVGASGAVSAVMGAFLFHFSTTNINVFWAFLLRFGTFRVPAYVALPFWLFNQFFYAWLYGEYSPVAYWAHIGGFAFGFGLAVLLTVSKLEDKYLSGRLERQDVVYEADPESDLGLAVSLFNEGDLPAADRIVSAVLTKRSDDLEALRLQGLIRSSEGRLVEAGATAARVLSLLARQPSDEPARRYWAEISPRLPREQLPLPMWMSLLKALRELGLSEPALHESALILRVHGISAPTVQAVLALADLAERQGNAKLALSALRRGLDIPHLEPIWEAGIRERLARIAPS